MAGRWSDAAASLLLGASCPGCRTPSARLCTACAASLARRRPFRVPGPAVPTVAAAPYDGLWRSCIIAFKEQAAWWLGPTLGRALAEAVAVSLSGVPRDRGALTLVPMPSQPDSVRDRGLDTTWLLARIAARCLVEAGLPARASRGLNHVRAVSDQSDLGVAARRANLAGALAARRPLVGPLVVVDDLTTTGASLAEACRALSAAGADPLACAVVAATPRHSTGERWVNPR